MVMLPLEENAKRIFVAAAFQSVRAASNAFRQGVPGVDKLVSHL
jgi:hypothetical protein